MNELDSRAWTEESRGNRRSPDHGPASMLDEHGDRAGLGDEVDVSRADVSTKELLVDMSRAHDEASLWLTAPNFRDELARRTTGHHRINPCECNGVLANEAQRMVHVLRFENVEAVRDERGAPCPSHRRIVVDHEHPPALGFRRDRGLFDARWGVASLDGGSR